MTEQYSVPLLILLLLRVQCKSTEHRGKEMVPLPGQTPQPVVREKRGGEVLTRAHVRPIQLKQVANSNHS